MDEKRDGTNVKDAGRRTLLKAAAVAGSAAASSMLLPGSWKKPVATLGGLPAHAQTSGQITINSLTVQVSTGTDADAALDGVLCTGKLSFQDELCAIDGGASLWVKVSPDCQEYTKSLGMDGISIPPNPCFGKIYFPFSACNSSFSVAVQLSRGSRFSNILNQSFDL